MVETVSQVPESMKVRVAKSAAATILIVSGLVGGMLLSEKGVSDEMAREEAVLGTFPTECGHAINSSRSHEKIAIKSLYDVIQSCGTVTSEKIQELENAIEYSDPKRPIGYVVGIGSALSPVFYFNRKRRRNNS